MAISDKLGNAFNRAKSGTIAVSLEAKKKLKESSIKGEISALESKMSSVYTQLGKEASAECFDELYRKNDRLKELLDSVRDYQDQVAAKERELEETMARLDAEIAAVKEGPAPAREAPADQPQEAQDAERPAPDAVFCSQCGAKNSVESSFCNQCGAKLEKN